MQVCSHDARREISHEKQVQFLWQRHKQGTGDPSLVAMERCPRMMRVSCTRVGRYLRLGQGFFSVGGCGEKGKEREKTLEGGWR